MKKFILKKRERFLIKKNKQKEWEKNFMNIIYSKKQYEYIDYNNNGTVNFIQEANNFLKVYRRKITFKYDIEKDNKKIAKKEALNSQLFNNNGGDANNYDNYSI